MSRDRTEPGRLVDDMAMALCGLRCIDDEARCILQLMQNGWRPAVIMKYLDEAMALARMARADGRYEPGEVSRHA